MQCCHFTYSYGTQSLSDVRIEEKKRKKNVEQSNASTHKQSFARSPKKKNQISQTKREKKSIKIKTMMKAKSRKIKSNSFGVGTTQWTCIWFDFGRFFLCFFISLYVWIKWSILYNEIQANCIIPYYFFFLAVKVPQANRQSYTLAMSWVCVYRLWHIPLSDDEIRYLHYCDYFTFISLLQRHTFFVRLSSPFDCICVHELYAERHKITQSQCQSTDRQTVRY